MKRIHVKKYQWILFDADETLFHFDSLRGLKITLSQFNKPFSQEDYQAYQILNKSLWDDYQNGDISIQQLQHQRFHPWSQKLNISVEELSDTFNSAMADICSPIEGAVSLLESLRGKFKLGIITNGFTKMQKTRLSRTGLLDQFDILVISEEVGVGKPHPKIFEHAFDLMGQPLREQVLMVGDNPDSDILGGLNAGVHTCWLNLNNKPTPMHITPYHQVGSLLQLEQWLFR